MKEQRGQGARRAITCRSQIQHVKCWYIDRAVSVPNAGEASIKLCNVDYEARDGGGALAGAIKRDGAPCGEGHT